MDVFMNSNSNSNEYMYDLYIPTSLHAVIQRDMSVPTMWPDNQLWMCGP